MAEEESRSAKKAEREEVGTSEGDVDVTDTGRGCIECGRAISTLTHTHTRGRKHLASAHTKF
jgi:hypothetical protein